MALLQTLGKGQGYLKAGFLGFQGSGKTKTAILLACALRKQFGLTGPVAFVDTENATEYVADDVEALTGKKLIGLRTRKFAELLAAGDECIKAGVSVMVADSMTHFWRSLCDAYLAGVNAARQQKGWSPRLKLEFQDWGQVKGQWAQWTDFFLNSPLHLIICGRAGYEYDMQADDKGGKKELVKTGVKMKTEAEFGFEPSLLVQMELEQEPDGNGKFRQVRQATILKDRFGDIDGRVFTFGRQDSLEAEANVVWKAFGPHVMRLKPGTHSTVATDVKAMEVDESGDAEWHAEKKARTILAEEIQGVMVALWPGQSAEDKKTKANVMEAVFGTRSWTAIEDMHSDRLREGLAHLRERYHPAPEPTQAAPAPAPEPKAAPKREPAPVGDDGGLGPQQPAQAPAKAVAQDGNRMSQETGVKLLAAIGMHVAKATVYARNRKWIGTEQDLEDLAEDVAQRILKNVPGFLTMIGVKKEAA